MGVRDGGAGWACWGAALAKLASYPNLRACISVVTAQKIVQSGFGYAARTAAAGGCAGVGIELRCGDLAADEVE